LQNIDFFYKNKFFLTEKVMEKFVSEVRLTPIIGVELEFYLFDADSFLVKNPDLIDKFIDDFSSSLPEDSLVYKIEKERGISQIEVKFSHTKNLIKLCEEIDFVKNKACELAMKSGLRACFLAQPILDDCGSAMQFNFSLHDDGGKNLFLENEKLIENSVAGILNFLDEMMIFCALNDDDFARYNFDRNVELHKKGKFIAPVNKSFGDDNRSCAIRVLAGKKFGENSRLEFRVPCVNSDQYLIISSFLIIILEGLKNNLIPKNSKKIYGNAFDYKYYLQNFVKDFDEARQVFFGKNCLVRKELENLI